MIQGPIELLGQFDAGGLGLLLRCRDQRGLVFAVKVPKDMQWDSQRMIDDEERRFQRYQGKYVVEYLGKVALPDGRRGFAMELMTGSLSALLRQRGALSPREVLGYLEDAARGLSEVHASATGAHHGDVKPGNLLHKGGRAKVGDFGLARGGLGQTMMVGPHTGGTPGYMPPEGMTSSAGDVYSLGITAVALLAGQEPDGETPVSITLPEHQQLIALLNQMLAANARQRPTMAQVIEWLPAIRAEATTAATNTVVKQVAGVAVAAGVLFLAVRAFAK